MRIRSLLYDILATAAKAIPRIGFVPSILFGLANYAARDVVVTPKGDRSRLRIRGNTSDATVFRHVLINEKYPVLPEADAVDLIIDAGAYVGYTAAFFVRQYPRAHVVAIEPEPSNFEILSFNTRDLPRIDLVNKALWDSETRVGFLDPRSEKWAGQVGPDAPAQDISTVTIEDILARHPECRHVLLKMDIEGAERQEFRGANRWLPRIDVLFVVATLRLPRVRRARDNQQPKEQRYEC